LTRYNLKIQFLENFDFFNFLVLVEEMGGLRP
jgi:hypothetical protein